MTASPPPNTAPPHAILLVEDDLDQAHLLSFLLEDTGRYRVRVAQDGVRGSKLAADGGWAIVITDLNLPGAFGFQVIEASQKNHPDTPVLATTGFSGPEYGEEAKKRGADVILQKPIDRDELLAEVHRLIQATEPEPARAQGPVATEAQDPVATEAQVPARTQTKLLPKEGVPLQVLAIGIRPGEVEAGAAGILLRHVARGDKVGLLVLSGRTTEQGDRARKAGRRLGASFFIGAVGTTGSDAFRDEVDAFLRSAIADFRPDVMYLPSRHRRDPLGEAVVEVALPLADDVPRILGYDAGDPTPEFRPASFVDVESTMEEKLQILQDYGAPEGSPLDPPEAALAARFWARYIDADLAEAFELLRGDAHWVG
jgi:DNA-binding response OmpR family regulator/LmbE family N-acetylglucosaminyl deacetylase